MTKYCRINQPFTLESGETLPSLTIAYHTYGILNEDKSNVIWVMHGLTANSDVADWWPHTVEKGKFLDPEKYFIVCANMLGSCYGTTGPSSVNPHTGRQWWGDFPRITIRDMVKCHRILAQTLGIKKIHEMIGVSLGGFQAIEWMVTDPEIAENVMFCATDSSCSPWLAAFNKSMYMAISTDPSFGEPRCDAARKGLATARAIALISYRGPFAYNMSQRDDDKNPDPFFHRVQTYQEYQGEKLCRRFDAYSYVRICESGDSHNVGRGRGGIQNALKGIKANTLVIGISSDILFPPACLKELADAIDGSTFRVMESDFAHDGFLIEHEKLNAFMQEWRENRAKHPQDD
ncbi:MAG: homoserine O-acetyltransferase [Muribaculaceae bacterium]|nr:homoserine O-acetyltransferase [Muribaculaceae bacterium]